MVEINGVLPGYKDDSFLFPTRDKTHTFTLDCTETQNPISAELKKDIDGGISTYHENPYTHKYVTRTEWGALRKKNLDGTDPLEKVRYPQGKDLSNFIENIVVHHTLMSFRDHYSPRRLQLFDFDGPHFDDLSYHFYITQDGTIHEGRSLDYIGAHAGNAVEANAAKDLSRGDPDYGSIGIALEGSFLPLDNPSEQATLEQEAALSFLLGVLMKHFPKIKIENIMPHSDVDKKLVIAKGFHPTRSNKLIPIYEPKTCPGAFSAKVYALAQEIALIPHSTASLALPEVKKQTLADVANELSDYLREMRTQKLHPLSVVDFTFSNSPDDIHMHGVHFQPDNVAIDSVIGRGLNFDAEWAGLGGVGAMINGGYFDYEGKPKGRLVVDGRVIAKDELSETIYSGLLRISSSNQWDLNLVRTNDQIKIPPRLSGSVLELQSGPMIINPGGIDGIPKPDKIQPRMAPRTVIVKSKSGEWYFLATQDSATLYNFQSAIRALVPDVDSAINLDGGPSTGLAIEGTGVMIAPQTGLPVLLHIKPRQK